MNHDLRFRNFIIFGIIILAAILRFWRLDSYPALNADEAAIGYNAYSLIQTGKDEHGNAWPIHFQSFSDYKPGLYFYLVLPFVKVLGLNEWAVRIPGATLGVLTVLALYFLVKELEIARPERGRRGNWKLRIIASLFLAISRWHIHFSRGGWEVNCATFFITAGLLFFVKATKKQRLSNFAFCILNFAFAMYAYHAARIIVPLLSLGLVIIYREQIFKNLKPFIISGAIGILLLLPLIKDLLGPAGISRAAGVGLFADPGPLNRINEQRGEHANFSGTGAKLLHNKAVNYGLAFLQNWAAHFHGEFLFLSGDQIQRNKVPETGQVYLFEIVTILVGIMAIFRKYSLYAKSFSLVLWWLIVAPTAAALTFQAPHALRAHNMVIPLTIISAYGLTIIINKISVIQLKNLRVAGYVLIGVLIFWSLARYEHMYWIHMSKEYPFSSQYGIKELVSYVRENQNKYDKIVVTDRYDQPYILFLFYLKYPPKKFQDSHILTQRDKFGFSTVDNFDEFYFENINFDKVKVDNPKSLIIRTGEEIPEEANIVKEIYGSNEHLYFEAVEN